jgi:hypothetical protein
MLESSSDQGGFPSSSSTIVQPRDQISDAFEAPCNEMISGATTKEREG